MTDSMPKESLAKVDDRRIIHRYVSKGMTAKEIGYELHWSPTTIARRLKANGIPIRGNKEGNPRLEAWVKEETLRLWEEGFYPAQIARIQGVSLSTMVQRLEKMGLPKRKRSRCVRGHEFTEENTHINKAGARVCRACMREANRQLRARRKGLVAAGNPD